MSTLSARLQNGTLLSRLIGLVLALGLTAIGVIVGFVQGHPAQQVILYAVATLALSAWAWRFYVQQFIAADTPSDDEENTGELRLA